MKTCVQLIPYTLPKSPSFYQIIFLPIKWIKILILLDYSREKCHKGGRLLEIFLNVLSSISFASGEVKAVVPCCGIKQIHRKATGYCKISRTTEFCLSDSRDYY